MGKWIKRGILGIGAVAAAFLLMGVAGALGEGFRGRTDGSVGTPLRQR